MATRDGAYAGALPDPSSSSYPSGVAYSGVRLPSVGEFPDPFIVSVTPPAGVIDPDPNVARWTPIVVVFEIPGGYVPMVIVRIGADSGVWLTAYDGAAAAGVLANGWCPLFSGKSVMTQAGNRYTASILPNGGWHRPNVRITPLAAREAV